MKIAVIGTGYIGISTMIYFTKAGFEVTGIDIDQNKVNLINQGKMPQKDLEDWLDFDPKKYLQKVKATTSFSILNFIEFDAIFIAVPTEKAGEPWFDPLEDVIREIRFSASNKDTLVIVESTLTPGIADKYVEPYIKNFAVAPRRDWFTDKDKTIETLPRIVGGNTEENTEKAANIIGNVCQTIHTCNAREAQLVKACENTIRHMGAVFAQQLAWAYPNLDTRKILKLASSKWNVPEYFANILGTSGYCIPVSSKYVKYGAKYAEELSILDEVLDTDKMSPIRIARQIVEKIQPKSIGILGVAYLGNIKVHVLSGALRFLEAWDNLGTVAQLKTDINIQIHDSLYSEEEIKKLTDKKRLKFPEDLDKFEVLIVSSDHEEYKNVDKETLIEKTKDCKLILDNCGIWEDVNFKCKYSVPGRTEWLKKIR